MLKRNAIGKCSKCGMMFEVLLDCKCNECAVTCCGEPVKVLNENTTDAAVEKHVPAIEEVDGGIKVTVGSTPHPMADDHYIEWVELVADGISYKQFLSPGDDPVVTFPVKPESYTVREHCNKHGLWKA